MNPQPAWKQLDVPEGETRTLIQQDLSENFALEVVEALNKRFNKFIRGRDSFYMTFRMNPYYAAEGPKRGIYNIFVNNTVFEDEQKELRSFILGMEFYYRKSTRKKGYAVLVE